MSRAGIGKDHLARQAEARLHRLLEHGVTQNDDAEIAVPLDEQFPPARLAHQSGDFVAATHDCAAFVEYRQHVAQTTTLAALFGDLRGVHRVDARLGFRECQPGKRVEQVVLVVRARLDTAGFEEMDFVIRVRCRGRDEADGLAAFIA